MDLEKELLREHSKRQISRMVEWVGSDPCRFRAFLDLMLGDGEILARRAAWVVGDAAEACPALARPHLPKLLDRLTRPALPEAVMRHIFRVLQFVTIPPRLEGKVLSLAMAALGGTAPIAVKAYAITLLKGVSDRYPEILPELRALIDEILPSAGPAIRSRVRREFGIGRRVID